MAAVRYRENQRSSAGPELNKGSAIVWDMSSSRKGLIVCLTWNGPSMAKCRAICRGFQLLGNRSGPALNVIPVTEIAHWENRSEEHTSELQSLRHLVCRLL